MIANAQIALLAIFIVSSLIYWAMWLKILPHIREQTITKMRWVWLILYRGIPLVLQNPETYLDDVGARLLRVYRKWFYVTYVIWFGVLIGLYLARLK